MINQLKDFIIILEDAISKKLCDEILNEYQNFNEWSEASVTDGKKEKLNKEIRNCKVISISDNLIIEKNKIIRKNLDLKVFECVTKVIEKYNKKFNNAKIDKDTGYLLLKYEKGGFYTQHIDSFTETPRTISCSFILNDNFKGGEFSFFNNTLTYDLKKGSAIMFPSNFLYPHSVLPVIDGTRYSIVTWFV